MSREIDEVFKRFGESAEGKHVWFTRHIDRSFHEESWSETVANEENIYKFAVWYASHSEPELKRLVDENTTLRKLNQDNTRKLGFVKSHLSWIESMIKGLSDE